MGDPDFFDSFVGLYVGQLSVTKVVSSDGKPKLRWKVEMPWKWPTYAELFAKYGDHHAQNFPIPNARVFIQGPKYCLRMDDGLGGHLETLGLAKSFLVYSDWEEPMP